MGRGDRAEGPGSGTKLALVGVARRFGEQEAVRDVSLAVPAGQVVVLLGPSGCGKTTTLRLVAGLLHPDAGTIWLDGQQVAGPGWGWPPERRNLAMVFQSYALWPHKTVFENVAYGLRVRRLGRREIERRVSRALELVQLPGLGQRYPEELSGGQQQRVALARALVVEPAVLLLDEPLSNLDAALRAEMRAELRALQRALGLTALYVTHDQAEAMVLADHLVVLRAGRVEQQGPPEALYRRPRTRFVAGFLGATNLVRGRVGAREGAWARFESPELGCLRASLPEGEAALEPGAPAWLSVRPGDLRVDPGPGDNRVPGRVEQRLFLGDAVEYTVQTRAGPWRIRTAPGCPLAVGEAVCLGFSPEAATLVLDT